MRPCVTKILIDIVSAWPSSLVKCNHLRRPLAASGFTRFFPSRKRWQRDILARALASLYPPGEQRVKRGGEALRARLATVVRRHPCFMRASH